MMKRVIVLATIGSLAIPLTDARPQSAPGGSAARALAPDSVLLTLPLGENEHLDFTLKQLMEASNVPGLSVAVIRDYRIAWARGYGVTEPGGSSPVTTGTLFQAGSISKPVAAAGALWLVERGRLSLDENVNDRLKSWQVPDNEFTAKEKVTLRRLLSHSAGLTVHGFPGYAMTEPVPTVVQILNGQKPANTPPVRVDVVPGTKYRYSGGGVTVEQQLMIDVTGKAFPEFMRDTVLKKAGMEDSTYEQPLPASRRPLAATGTRSDGKAVEGRFHVYPEMAAAGLWTTPTDLAKFAIEIALSRSGKSNRILSQKMTREMLASQIKADEGAVGLGFFLEDGEGDWFGHNGADEGFQALLTMSAATGNGIAIMGNSDAVFQVAAYVEDAVAAADGWRQSPRGRNAAGVLLLMEARRGTQAALDLYARVKARKLEGYHSDENTLNQLGYRLLGKKKMEEAIRVFQLNVREYPNHWNSYDSLGEAYMVAGKKDLAIENYQKSVDLNPENKGGIDALKKLREKS